MRNVKCAVLAVVSVILGGCMVGCVEETLSTAIWLAIVNAVTSAIGGGVS